MPISSMPTQPHDFGNHNNGYGFTDSTHTEIAGCWTTASSTVGNPETVSKLDEDYDF
jgi:hypothetical protein